MAFWKNLRWIAALGIGLAIGLVISGLWPHTPLYAVATDRIESYGMATGPLDADVEAVYFLDFLTGQLTAVVLGKQPGTWTGFYSANVAADMHLGDKQTTPKFLMTTGVVNLRRGGGSRMQPANSVCYVAEVTSGQVAAYNIPWSPSMYASSQPQMRPIPLIGITSFRQGTGAGPGSGGGAVPAK
jgi:hypothetical protein